VHYGSGTDSGGDVYLNSHSRTDFGDVRFTDDDGVTELAYWMESKVDGDYAIFWVKVNDDLSTTQQTIYIYYGKSDATTTSNGANTFLSFDDFEDGVITDWTATTGVSISETGGLQTLTLTTSQWDKGIGAYRATSFLDGIEVIARGAITTARSDTGFGLMLRFSDTNNAFFTYWDVYGTGEFRLYKIIGGTLTGLQIKDGTGKPTVGQFYIWHFRVTPSGNLSVEVEGYNTLGATDTSLTSGKVGTYIRGISGGVVKYDWFFVKKYVSPEPSHGSWGSEETVAIVETIVAKNFPMNYLPSPVKAEQLTSKVSGATIQMISQDYPITMIKSGKAEELKSKWSS
jgi:hypothetical protein